MAFGDKKQPEMFEAFRQSKGDKEAEPLQGLHPPPPSGRPLDVKPPIPMAGKVKPPVVPSGQQAPKPIVPTLEEAKARAPEPGLFDDKDAPPKPQGPAEKPRAAAPAAPVAPIAPVAPVMPAPATPVTPAPAAPVSDIKVIHRDATPAAAKPSVPAAAPSPIVPPVPVASKPVAPIVAPAAAAPRPVASVAAQAPRAAAPSTPAQPARQSVAPGASNLNGLKDSKDLHVVEFGKKSEVVFGLSYHALAWILAGIVGAVIVIVLVAVAIGRHATPGDSAKKTEPAKTESGNKTTGTTLPPATSPFPAGTYYTVQVLRVTNDASHLKDLDAVEAFLKKDKHLTPVVRRTSARGDMVSVFVGAFTREQKPEADAMAKRIQMLMPNSKYDFKGANVVSLTK